MAKVEPIDKLKGAGQEAFKALGGKAMSSVTDRVGGLTEKLEGVASGNPVGKAAAKAGEEASEGGSPAKGALKGAMSGIKDKITGGGGGKGGGGKETKSTNITETIDVGVPVRVAYDLWTEFGGFPSFMKKVESVEAQDETTLAWKAQIFWSHRTWEATIQEQVPDERIVWRSKGEKGHVDGAVTFHEITPDLTRILVVLEYYPQGFFEKTGNIWEAQGRRARAEFRHFRRHVMVHTMLEPDELEGWRGTIRDGEVVQTHEEALEEEEQQQQEDDEAQEQSEAEYEEEGDEAEPEDEFEEESEEEGDEAEPEDEYEEESDEEAEPDEEYEEEPEPEEEYEEEGEAAEPEDEYEEEAEPEEEYEEEPEAEYEEEPDPEDEEPEEQPRKRSRRRAS